MKLLEDRIREEGIVKPGDVLKIDAFLNHQCDVALFDKMGGLACSPTFALIKF